MDVGNSDPIHELERMEELARVRGLRIYSIYLRLPWEKQCSVDRLLDKMIRGRLSYWEVLLRLKILYRKHVMGKTRGKFRFSWMV